MPSGVTPASLVFADTFGKDHTFLFGPVGPCSTCTDEDGDGYGSQGSASCPAGAAEDCNDHDASIHPGAPELPGNFVDENCDGNLGECDPCSAWRNHGEYVRCVAHAVENLVTQGFIGEAQGDTLVSSAAQSSVGKKDIVPAGCQ